MHQFPVDAQRKGCAIGITSPMLSLKPGDGDADNRVPAMALGMHIQFAAHHFAHIHLGRERVLSGFCSQIRMLGTDTHYNFLIDVRNKAILRILLGGELYLILDTLAAFGILRAELNKEVVADLAKNAVDKVHLRRTDKAGNEGVAGSVVKMLRSIDLLNITVLHNDYTVGHGRSGHG